MKRMILVAGVAVGALMLSGCGVESGTPPSAMTVADLKAKLLGSWDSQKSENSCLNSIEGGTSSKANIYFGAADFNFTKKKYSELGCKEADLTFDVTYTYNYKIGAKQTPSDSNITVAFEFDITSTGLDLRKGSLNSIPNGETYYTSLGLDTAGHFEFAYKDGHPSSKDKTKRPTDFNTTDKFYFEKQE